MEVYWEYDKYAVGGKMMCAWKNFSQLFNIKSLKHLFHFSCKFKKNAYFLMTFLFFNCVCNVIMTSREQQWR